MIEYPTNCHIKGISKLFCSLLDLIGEKRIDPNHNDDDAPLLPDDIQSLVQNLRVAYRDFDNGINKYMHQTKHDISEIKIMKTIVEETPYHLSLKDADGNLPIHAASQDDSSSSTYVPLLAKAGVEHRVGGEKGRGGLLISSTSGSRPLKKIVKNGGLSTIKALRNTEPTLLKPEDIKRGCLIHNAVLYDHLDLIKVLTDVHPQGLYEAEGEGKIPIYFAKSLEVTKILIKTAIKHDPNHTSIGGLFAKNKGGILTINIIIDRFGKSDAWKCIEEGLSQSKDIPILHKAILYAPEHVENILTSFPHASFLRDENGRLPIHVALETGMKWSTLLVSIMNANTLHLGEVDPMTKFCPSALAAVEPSCDLRTISYLLRMHPKHIEVSKPNEEHRAKRQKLTHDEIFIE